MFLFIVFIFSEDPPVCVMIEWFFWVKSPDFYYCTYCEIFAKSLKGLGGLYCSCFSLVFCFLRWASTEECLKIFWTAGPSCIEIKILGLILISWVCIIFRRSLKLAREKKMYGEILVLQDIFVLIHPSIHFYHQPSPIYCSQPIPLVKIHRYPWWINVSISQLTCWPLIHLTIYASLHLSITNLFLCSDHLSMNLPLHQSHCLLFFPLWIFI